MGRRIAVFGAGSWGTALAAAVARQFSCLLWARDSDLAQAMQDTQTNPRYLPGIVLPERLRFTDNLSTAWDYLFEPAAHTPLLILGVPVAGLAEACENAALMAQQYQKPLHVIWTCKGIEPQHLLFPHQIAAQFFSQHPWIKGGVLSGPSFAKEVALKMPVALTIGTQHTDLYENVIQAFHSEYVRIYHHSDILGMEVGGALKNIIAIACGVSDGLGLGMNARAAIITRGLSEMTRLGVSLGAQSTTFQGLTGLGDLVLTCTGDLSRNRKVGQLLAEGLSLPDILAQMKQVAEGVRCTAAAHSIAEKQHIELPITNAIYTLLEGNASAQDMVYQLMLRRPKQED